MIRVTEEYDLPFIRELIKSVQGWWHDQWQSDVLERAYHPS